METTTALEVFEQGLTKSVIKSMAQQAIEAVKESGNILKVAEAISAMETFIKEVKADESFKEYAREEISKYPKGYVSPSGAKLECAETGTKYCFDNCNDWQLPLLYDSLEAIKLQIKTREDFIKTLPLEGLEVLVPDSEGEVVKVFPPSKSSTSSYKVSLAK